MKIAVIGGGSSYTPELVNGFLARTESLPLGELWLADVDAERLQIVGGLAQRMVHAQGDPFAVSCTCDRRAAVRGADYVVTQLRVGGMAARREDEYLGRRHGLIGQETTGVGGMAKALRTIPVVLDIARDVRELAPGALLINFTNPAGLVTEALNRFAPEVSSVGVCNVPINTKMQLLELLTETGEEQIAPERAQLDTLGLNHLTWHRGFTIDGQDVWPEVWQRYLDLQRRSDSPAWSPDLLEALGMIPNSYLVHYYDTSLKLESQAAWPPSRAEAVMAIEAALLRDYADPERCTPPASLAKRGGAYYSTAATQLINAHWNDLNEVHVVNTVHGDAVAGWPADWVLELPCRVGRCGIRPLSAQPLPPDCLGLLTQVKAYEQLTVAAAVHGDRQAAWRALLIHPLGPDAAHTTEVLEDLLRTSAAYLPHFR